MPFLKSKSCSSQHYRLMTVDISAKINSWWGSREVEGHLSSMMCPLPMVVYSNSPPLSQVPYMYAHIRISFSQIFPMSNS